MVKGTDFHTSSVYRAGWGGTDGFTKSPLIQEGLLEGKYLVPTPLRFKDKVKWRTKRLLSILLEEEDAESPETLEECVKRGLSVFVSKRSQ